MVCAKSMFTSSFDNSKSILYIIKLTIAGFSSQIPLLYGDEASMAHTSILYCSILHWYFIRGAHSFSYPCSNEGFHDDLGFYRSHHFNLGEASEETDEMYKVYVHGQWEHFQVHSNIIIEYHIITTGLRGDL